MKHLRHGLVAAGILFSCVAHGHASGLTLELEPIHITVLQGQRPGIHLFVSNRGTPSVILVKPGDGSAWGWRTPLVGVSIVPSTTGKHPPASEIPLLTWPRCLNINSIERGEVFTLAAGGRQEINLRSYLLQPLTVPGTFRMVLYYINDPSHSLRGEPLGGGHDAAALALIRSSTAATLRSNEVTVTVVPK